MKTIVFISTTVLMFAIFPLSAFAADKKYKMTIYSDEHFAKSEGGGYEKNYYLNNSIKKIDSSFIEVKTYRKSNGFGTGTYEWKFTNCINCAERQFS